MNWSPAVRALHWQRAEVERPARTRVTCRSDSKARKRRTWIIYVCRRDHETPHDVRAQAGLRPNQLGFLQKYDDVCGLQDDGHVEPLHERPVAADLPRRKITFPRPNS